MQDRKRPLIVVDPGHGGSDPGAVNGRLGFRESDITLQLAEQFKRYATAVGFDIIVTRDGDNSVSLEERARLSNLVKPACFLSFHCNAALSLDAHGFEVWTSLGTTGADPVATAIFLALLKVNPVGRTDYDDGDPDKEANFYVLRHTVCPAVLIEFGFISNDQEARWLAARENQEDLVFAVLKGLKEAL